MNSGRFFAYTFRFYRAYSSIEVIVAERVISRRCSLSNLWRRFVLMVFHLHLSQSSTSGSYQKRAIEEII